MSRKIAFFTILLCLILFSCQQKQNEKLILATASNMQFAMVELVKTFENKTGIETELILGSSGKLTAQIINGAPYDVFISADMKYPQEVFDKGFAVKPPRIYAFGKLVLWTTLDSLVPSIKILLDANIKHIAIANPKTAPYGVAAIEVLNYFNMFDKIKHKLVYGESISQTNQFVMSKSAEIGFTAKSVVLSSSMKNKGNWIDIDENSYTPIAQGAVVIKNTKHSEKAQQFYEFLFSAEAKQILKANGYGVEE